MVYPALLPPMRKTRLPVVDWTDALADLNGIVLYAERRNLVSARVPSHFKRSLPLSLVTKSFCMSTWFTEEFSTPSCCILRRIGCKRKSALCFFFFLCCSEWPTFHAGAAFRVRWKVQDYHRRWRKESVEVELLREVRKEYTESNNRHLHVRLFSSYQLNAQFLYSSTVCILHYDPQHVSSSTLLILRRTNCITTATGIVNLCKQPYSMLSTCILYGYLQRVTIPEAVVIQLVLLMMSSVLLETCWGAECNIYIVEE